MEDAQLGGYEQLIADIRTNSETVRVYNYFLDRYPFVLTLNYSVQDHNICIISCILCLMRLGDMELHVYHYTASKIQCRDLNSSALKSESVVICTHESYTNSHHP